MKTAYVAAVGQSNHGWGGAVDIDVGALVFPGIARGSNEALAAFWEIAESFGWLPIITRPSVGQSECWHFDHLGPLAEIRDLFVRKGMAGSAYAQTAMAGHALAGVLPGELAPNVTVAYIQSRLLLAGYWVGKVDGVIGPKTLGALAEVGVGLNKGAAAESVLPSLDRIGLAREAIEAA
jgi:hypothetical protein